MSLVVISVFDRCSLQIIVAFGTFRGPCNRFTQRFRARQGSQSLRAPSEP